MQLPAILRRGFTLPALGVGLAVFLLLTAMPLTVETAAMLGWSAHVLTHASLLLYRLGKATPETMRSRAREVVEGRRVVSILSVVAAAASLLFLVFRWDGLGGGVAIPAIILSWFYVHLLFAQDYAHEYWMHEYGIEFPGGDGTPEFSEFLYFAFTIGMTFQVSDVTTSSPAMRRLVLTHGLVAFGFNAVILAAAVNIVAGGSN
ncbi:DUF1345 domain-containing protein [Roseococcus sp. SDR]|uniref:DUF1345 domain-containing protein n=1 Tax=Roseococcus sp. SDR TaxID=2835532 RepID=UPI001BD1ACCD|nr:DUF1345 domain-containing protein [Roseococcus sp. SDR]MBS7790237.1 DUF1345 domain-containing protein [Roseococcus sp. SDR]MBV1845551.1 DUF1345 domain-containing protein [Roseococcus sp. SDR]